MHKPPWQRTPFILIGTIAAAVALIALSFTDGMQLKNIEAVSAIDDRAALETLYDSVSETTLEMPDGTEFVLSETFSRGDFASITSQVEMDGAAVTNPDYTNYVVPARHAYAHAATRTNPLPLILFIGILLVALISMATFRSPAVALMPDVTIKPLRSKANAIINLMGTAGGILVLGMGVVFGTGAAKNALMPYATFFSIVAGIMLLALLAFMLTVREPKFVREMETESRRFHIDELPEGETGKDAKRPLSKEERASLLLILASVVFWFMGYNAVISKYSVYAGKVLDLDYNTTLLLANIAAMLAPLSAVGMIASKIGRKKTILAGIVMLATSFGVASFLREGSSALVMNCMFALAGIGWATINVNSFPMVVELSRGGDVGKYTGFYYTASMAAQTITPYFSGLLMDKIGMTTLFPYATIFVAIAFGTMLFVKHGDSRPEQPKSKLEALGGEE